MKTSDFPYLDFPFEEFNKPQSEAIQFADKDCNLVVALNTSTGKTAVALCFFAHEIAKQIDSKCIYASPLKAISEERYEQLGTFPEWNHVPKLINTSDYMADADDFMMSKMIIVTSETLDSKSRNEKIHGEWLKKVGVLVIDEMHLLDEPKRGAALEAGLVNFTRINKDARIVGLSATMSNATEIASWLKSLNGKPTFCVSSDWRPVKLNKKWVGIDKVRDRWQNEQNMIDSAINIVLKNREDKLLLFVHSKRIGKNIVDALKSFDVKAAFYHSGLKPAERNILAEQFKNRLYSLNVLVTTSALAQGVNL